MKKVVVPMSNAVRLEYLLCACLAAAGMASCSKKVAPSPMDQEEGWTCQVSRGDVFRDLDTEQTQPFVAFYNELKRASWNVPIRAKRTTKATADYRVLFTRPATKSRHGQNASIYILVYLPQMLDVDGGGLFEVNPEGIKQLTDAIRSHLGGDAGINYESLRAP